MLHNEDLIKGLKVCCLCMVVAMLAMLPTMIEYKGMFIVRGDFIQQQIPFILECKRMLATGRPWWSWNTFLGSNFVGSYSFYSIGSPFFWILMLIPTKFIVFANTVLIIVKLGIAGFSSYLYIRKFVRKEQSAVLGAILYSFSGFMIVNTQFHFTDVIALFPFMMVALENIFAGKRKYGQFALAVAINFLTNFYMFFAAMVFIVLYSTARFLWADDWRGSKGAIFTAVIELTIGSLIACILFIPTVPALFGLPRTHPDIPFYRWIIYSPFKYFELIRVLFMPIESNIKHAFYVAVSSWTSTGIHLPVFGFCFVLIYLKKSWDWLAKLIVLLLIMTFIPLLNSIFSMFSNVEYTRWWFALSIIIALATSKVIDAGDKISSGTYMKYIKYSLLIILAVTIPFLILPYLMNFLTRVTGSGLIGIISEMYDSLVNWRYGGLRYQIISYALTLLNFIVLILYCLNARARKYVVVLVSIVSVINFWAFIHLNNNEVFDAIGNNTLPTNLEYYADRYFNEPLPCNNNEYSYRIDSPHEIRNYSMLVNIPSVNTFTSTGNYYSDKFGVWAGFGEPGSVSMLAPEKPELLSLLSVKYCYNYDRLNHKFNMPGFTKIKDGRVEIWENKNYIPMGFAYDEYINVNDLPKGDTALLLKAIALDEGQILKYKDILKEYKPVPVNKNSWVSDAQKRKAASSCWFSGNSEGFDCKIQLKKEQLIFFSVPYSEGWKAWINNKPVEIDNVNIGFMSVRVPPGANNIKFRYTVPGLIPGAIFSLLGIIALAAYLLYSRYYRAKKEYVQNMTMKL